MELLPWLLQKLFNNRANWYVNSNSYLTHWHKNNCWQVHSTRSKGSLQLKYTSFFRLLLNSDPIPCFSEVLLSIPNPLRAPPSVVRAAEGVLSLAWGWKPCRHQHIEQCPNPALSSRVRSAAAIPHPIPHPIPIPLPNPYPVPNPIPYRIPHSIPHPIPHPPPHPIPHPIPYQAECWTEEVTAHKAP